MKLRNSTFAPPLMVLVSFFFISCSPQKRLTRLLAKHPKLMSHDTFSIPDTIRINSTSADTHFYYLSTTDTVIIDKGQLQIKYFYSKDTVFISGHCKDSLIIRQLPFIQHTILGKNTTDTWKWLLAGALSGILLIFLIRRIF